jgi:hypothetical protein
MVWILDNLLVSVLNRQVVIAFLSYFYKKLRLRERAYSKPAYPAPPHTHFGTSHQAIRLLVLKVQNILDRIWVLAERLAVASSIIFALVGPQLMFKLSKSFAFYRKMRY